MVDLDSLQAINSSIIGNQIVNGTQQMTMINQQDQQMDAMMMSPDRTIQADGSMVIATSNAVAQNDEAGKKKDDSGTNAEDGSQQNANETTGNGLNKYFYKKV